MSTEEDTELRDLVTQMLESNGALGRIKAELRANVFLALQDQETINKRPKSFANTKLQNFCNSDAGRTVTSLVYEFLEYFNLDFTLAVFGPESNSRELYNGRKHLANDLDFNDNNSTFNEPLLAHVFRNSLDTNEKPPNDVLKKFTDSNDENRVAESDTSDVEKNDFNHVDYDNFFDDELPNNMSKYTSLSINKKQKNSEDEKTNSSQSHKPKNEAKYNSNYSYKDSSIDSEEQDSYSEDEFENSNASHFGITPRSGDRSGRSDRAKSIEEEIVEEDDLSEFSDHLKSNGYNGDEITTDRTVSPSDQNDIDNYFEDIDPP